MPLSSPPPSHPSASIDVYVDWPTHGRSLQLGEVRLERGDSLEAILQDVWSELSRVAEELALDSPCRFRAVRIEWPARDGRHGCVTLHPEASTSPSVLNGELSAVLGPELAQRGIAWNAPATQAEIA